MPNTRRGSLPKRLKYAFKKRSIFIKYFFAFFVLEILCFVILAVAVSFFGTNNWTKETMKMLSENTKQVADLTEEILTNRMQPDMQNATFLLCNNISMISEAIDADIYVCNMDGRVILCKDLVSDNFEISSNGECIVHSFYAIPQSIINSIGENGSSSPASTLDGVYTKSQMYSARPVIVDGKTVAIVFAVKPASLGALNYLSNSMKIFLVGSLFALVIGAIATYFFTNDLLSPLKDMSRATKCYAKGDFSYRVKVRKNDDTELAHLLRAFNSMASSLALYESSRRSFVANVSHELKTPMTTISGFIDGILDGTIPPEKEKHYLEIVSNETKRLSRLVVAMLNISKIEAGELNLNPVNFNICNDIFNVLVSFEQQIEQKNIEICGLDALVPTTVCADEDLIHQVIYNLVDNAVKFTENGKIFVFVEKNDDNTVSVKIRNTGAGISNEELSKVFERFYKVDKSRSYDTKSAGLGLYIVKTVVELHGGTVSAESVEDEYTQFEFTIPNDYRNNA